MTEAELNKEAGLLSGRLMTFEGGFVLDERGPDGASIIIGPADSVQLVRSALVVDDVDDDGVPDLSAAHWINIRLGSIDEERVHVRKIVSFTDTTFALYMRTANGGLVVCNVVDEDTDAGTRAALGQWWIEREDNRAAYDSIGKLLTAEAVWLSLE